MAVHNIWVCLYAAVLRVGESDRNARHEELMFKGACSAAGGDTHMVFGDYIPILWPNKLRRRSPSR